MRGNRRLAAISVGAAACLGLAVGGPALGGQGFPGSGLGPLQEIDEFEEVEFDEPGSFPFVVPEDVCEIGAVVAGAQGGENAGVATSPGGLGGGTVAPIEVTPGETLQVNVGEEGQDGDDGGGGGFNGGGDGGDGTPTAGGGGGASDVRFAPFGLGDRAVVAGGGGGSGTREGSPAGGDGGGLSGEAGESGSGGGGGGGTQVAGGAGGTAGDGGDPGDDGALGTGGDGASNTGSGGGGGGGLFGGGGGGSVQEDEPGGGGGGGSGFGPPDASHFTGVNEGDGFVVLFFFAPDPGCDIDRAIPARPVAAEPRLTG